MRPQSSKSTLPKVEVRASQFSSNQTTQRRGQSARKSSLQNNTAESYLKTLNIQEGLQLYQRQLETMAQSGKPAQFQSEVKKLFAHLNEHAMRLLEKPSTQELSLLILQWIIEQSHYELIPNQKCIALNNLGCAYRRLGKVQMACSTIEQALELVKKYDQVTGKAITYLDLTAVLSQMGLHDRALACAREAVSVAKLEFSASDSQSVKYLAIALYNLGVEFDATNKIEEAVKQHKTALQFLREHLNEKDPLVGRFEQSYQKAKEKLILQSTVQGQAVMKNILQKKHFDITSDDSVVQTTPQPKNKANFLIRPKQNFIEDQLGQESEMGKTMKVVKFNGEKPVDPMAVTRKISLQTGTQLDEMGLMDWSDSDQETQVVAQRREVEKPLHMKLINVGTTNKDLRMHFLNRMNVNKKDDRSLVEKEQQIIREVENQIYNVNKIKKIQAQYRMKEQQKKFFKIKKQYQEQGKLLASDELKLKKFQRFVRRKLAQLKMRKVTRDLVARIRLRKFPDREFKARVLILAMLRGLKVYRQLSLTRQVMNLKQYHSIRSAVCFPMTINEYGVLEPSKMDSGYTFTFSVQNPDQLFVRFSLAPLNRRMKLDKKNRIYLEIDTQTFLQCLGLIEQYIEQLEAYEIEQSELVTDLKQLQMIGHQFVRVTIVDGKYQCRNNTDTVQQFKQALSKVAPILQKLLVVKQGQLIIHGFTDFEYSSLVPEYEQLKVQQPPMYLRNVKPKELKRIIFIQTLIRQFLSKARVKRMKQRKRHIYSQELVITAAKEYIRVHKIHDDVTNRDLIHLVDIEHKCRTNDLVIVPHVFHHMGEINKDNIYEIFDVSWSGPSMQYSQEANYWIQKFKEMQEQSKYKITPKSLNKAATFIQRNIQAYLFKRKASVNLANTIRTVIQNKGDVKKEILLRKATLYGEEHNLKASLTTFYLFVEQADPTTTIMGQSEYQSIMITSKTLEHMYAFDKVQPYFQRLFYAVERSKLLTIAQRMVDKSKIVKSKKEGFKVDTKSLDEVQGEMSNEHSSVGDEQAIRDITLDARILLNLRFRDLFIQQVNEAPDDQPEFVMFMQGDQTKQTNYVKILQNRQKFHSKRQALRISMAKHVIRKDDKSINTYVKNFLPTTEYGTEEQQSIITKEDDSKDHSFDNSQQNLARRSTVLKESIPLYKDYVLIDGHEMLIQLLYYVQLQQLIVIGEMGGKQYKIVVSQNSLLGGAELNYNYFQDNVQMIVLPQLHFKEDILYFQVDAVLQSQLMKEQNQFEKSAHEHQESHNKSVSQLLDNSILKAEKDPNVVWLGQYTKAPFLVEYQYLRSTKEFQITYTKDEPRKILFKTKEFESTYVETWIPLQSNKGINNFFKQTVIMINGLLRFNEDGTNNFDTEVFGQLGFILREKFVQKIQGMMLVRRTVEKLKMYKSLKHPRLVLEKHILNSFSHYIQVSYVLVKQKYQLVIIVKELTSVTSSGQVFEKSKTQSSKFRLREKHFIIDLTKVQDLSGSNLANSQIRRQSNLEFKRLDCSVLQNYSQMKTLDFYRQLFSPFISIIQKYLTINFPKFQIDINLDLPIEEQTIKESQRKKTISTQLIPMRVLIKAALQMQRSYKRMLHKTWYNLKLSRQKDIENRNKHVGTFMKRAFKKIASETSSKMYIVNVYQRAGKTPESLRITFELIPMLDRSAEQKPSDRALQRIRGHYLWEPTKMLNLGAMTLYNYIMDLIFIENGIMRFRGETLQEPQANEIVEEVAKAQSPQLVEQEVEERLIGHDQKESILYNVVYTGGRTVQDRKNMDQQDKSNTVTLEVNMKNIRKLYPTMNVKSAETMKIISQSLIQGVKVNDGKVQLDQAKIAPSFINIVQSQLPEKQLKPTRRPQKPHLKQDLVKTTVMYAGEKFLMVIYYIERKINKILQASHDQVFQEFEQVYQLSGTNLSRLNQQNIEGSVKSQSGNGPIIWEITPEEATILTHETIRDRIATVLSQRAQILNGNFIYLCFQEVDLLKIRLTPDQKVVLFVEKTIKPIQDQIRNRRLRQNYKYYRQIINQYKQNLEFTSNVALFDTRTLNSKKHNFIVLCVEDEQKKIKVIAWDYNDKFYMLQLEIPKQKYASMLAEDKLKCMRALVNFVTYDAEIGKLIFTAPKSDQLLDFFEEEKRHSQHQNSIEISPLKIQIPEDIIPDDDQSPSPSMIPNQMDFDSIQEGVSALRGHDEVLG